MTEQPAGEHRHTFTVKSSELKAIEDYIYSNFNHTPEWKKAEQAYQNILSSCADHTPAQQCPHWRCTDNLKSDFRDQNLPRFYCDQPAQQRIDAAIKELKDQINMLEGLEPDRGSENWCAMQAYKRAIALLQAGGK